MKTKTILILCIFCASFSALSYKHPGAKSFFEVGALKNRSVFGYEVHTPYAVPKFSLGPVRVEAFRLNANLLQVGTFSVGPVLSYNFAPYVGDEIEHLKGMKRSGFLEAGILGTLALPMGKMIFQASRALHDNPGSIFKVSLASGLPLFALNGNNIWLNILTEYSYSTKDTATYMFGVRKKEQTFKRASHTLGGLSELTIILGLWTPISKSWWVNLTYKFDNFQNEILKSPIVKRDREETLMVGLMYSFGS